VKIKFQPSNVNQCFQLDMPKTFSPKEVAAEQSTLISEGGQFQVFRAGPYVIKKPIDEIEEQNLRRTVKFHRYAIMQWKAFTRNCQCSLLVYAVRGSSYGYGAGNAFAFD
jgi:hypothetical protein